MALPLAPIWRRHDVFIGAFWVSRSCIPFRTPIPTTLSILPAPGMSFVSRPRAKAASLQARASASRSRWNLPIAVPQRHRWLSENAASFEDRADPGPLCSSSRTALSFIFTDPDANSWEIIAAVKLAGHTMKIAKVVSSKPVRIGFARSLDSFQSDAPSAIEPEAVSRSIWFTTI